MSRPDAVLCDGTLIQVGAAAELRTRREAWFHQYANGILPEEVAHSRQLERQAENDKNNSRRVERNCLDKLKSVVVEWLEQHTPPWNGTCSSKTMRMER